MNTQITGFHRVGRLIKAPSLIHSFPCGSSGPADDESMEYFEIPEMFLEGIKEPYVIEARGDSMAPKISEGDRLIIDHLAEPKNKDAVVAYLNGEYLIKYLELNNGGISLVPSNPKYKNIAVTEEDDFKILGIVKWVVSKPGR